MIDLENQASESVRGVDVRIRRPGGGDGDVAQQSAEDDRPACGQHDA